MTSNASNNQKLRRGDALPRVRQDLRQGPVHVCEFCFGPLEIAYDYAAIAKVLTRAVIESPPSDHVALRGAAPLDGPPSVGRRPA